MPRLSVRQLFERRHERLGLAWAAGRAGEERELTGEMLRKPGVGLISHLNLIHPLLVQVLGPAEVDYLDKLEDVVREKTAAHVVGGDTICVIVGDDQPAPREIGRAHV